MILSPRLRPFLFAFVGLVIALPSHAQPHFIFLPQQIVAGGITANAEVLLFGGGQAEERGVLVFHNYSLAQHGSPGVQGTTFAFDAVVPEHSIWLLLDRSSGQWTIDSPDPTADLEVPFPSTALASSIGAGGGSNALDVLDIPWRRSRFVIIRQGSYSVGTRLLIDGSAVDGDGDTNRRVEMDLALLQPVSAGNPLVVWPVPTGLAAGDIVAVFDLDKTRMAVTTITPDDLKKRTIDR